MVDVAKHIDVLDLGCGTNKTPGAFGVDVNPDTAADLVADLDVYPYDLPESRFQKIVCSHIVEHVADIPAFFNELHRLAKPGATIQMITPHFTNRCSYADPTHRHHLSAQFVEFFAEVPGRVSQPGSLSILTNYFFEYRHDYTPPEAPPRFKLVSRKITFPKIFRMLGVQWLANRFYQFWEFYLCFLLPARDIHLVLEVVK